MSKLALLFVQIAQKTSAHEKFRFPHGCHAPFRFDLRGFDLWNFGPMSCVAPDIITSTAELAAFCDRCAAHPFVTLDTEFLRERTYYSQLCLIQMAHPGEEAGSARLIDPLSPDLDLDPLYALFANRAVTKVFHAARQDLEIFFVDRGVFPTPFFDTQVAAMVCGFGEQVGYETLVRKITKGSLDKSSRFTDWSRRPLSDKQQAYALADVTHLRQIYLHLAAELDRTGRRAWVEEELQGLVSPATYASDPAEAWRRIKTRNATARFLAVVRELARFREETAQARNQPRNRILKDDSIVELAGLKPKTVADLGQSRLLLRDARRGEIAEGLVAAVARGLACPPDQMPQPPKPAQRRNGADGVEELLRVLLKARAEQAGVAPKLIATASDLDAIASGATDVPTLRGWREELFGADALRLRAGELALAVGAGGVRVIETARLDQAGTAPE